MNCRSQIFVNVVHMHWGLDSYLIIHSSHQKSLLSSVFVTVNSWLILILLLFSQFYLKTAETKEIQLWTTDTTILTPIFLNISYSLFIFLFPSTFNFFQETRLYLIGLLIKYRQIYTFTVNMWLFRNLFLFIMSFLKSL